MPAIRGTSDSEKSPLKECKKTTLHPALNIRMELTVLTLEETIELILKHSSDYDRKGILRLIDEKRQELGPEVVNEESAAMIVARELGIDLQQVSPNARMRVEDITESSRSVTLTAKVVNVGALRTFSKPSGGEGKVASIIVADETGQIRVALWDEMADAIEEGPITLGSVVQIRGAYVKKGLRDALELNLGRMGGIRVLDEYEAEDLDIKTAESKSAQIADLQDRMFDVTLTARLDALYGISTFTRKSDGAEGKVASATMTDDTGSVRVVFWDQYADQMKDAKPGEVIRLSGAYTKTGRNGEVEVHAGRSAKIERGLKQKISAARTPAKAAGAKSVVEAVGRKSIVDLSVEMRDVDIEGKVAKVFPPTSFEREGKQGKVQNIVIGDESGTVRATFWNEDAEKVKDLQEGDVIRIQHGYVKEGFRGGVEYHAGRQSDIQINPSDTHLDQLDLSEMRAKSVVEAVGRKSIVDLSVEMRDVDIEGKVAKVFPPTSFERKGKQGKVQNIVIGDESGTVRVTFWNEDVEKVKDLQEGDVIRIQHGYVKEGFRGGVEYHAGRRSDIQINPSDTHLDQLDLSEIAVRPAIQAGRVMISEIDDAAEGKTVEVCGIVVVPSRTSPVYASCPKCRKKTEEKEGKHYCVNCGKVEKPEYRMLYKVTIDDGSGSIRVTLFGKTGEELLQMTAQEAQELIAKSGNKTLPIEKNSDKVLGRYVAVRGRVARFREALEISANELILVNPIEEAKRLRESVTKLVG